MYAICVESRYSEGPSCPTLVDKMPSSSWIIKHVVDWAITYEKPKITRGDAAGSKAGETSARLVMEWHTDDLLVVVYKTEVQTL